jgi:hypothetical protein
MEKRVIRNMTFLLCFMMVLRHYGFYSGQGIEQEFGFDQPTVQLLLLPVTGLFGGLIHFNNMPIVSRYDWLFIKMLLLIILVVSINGFDVVKIITYSIDDPSRRPRFLILIPIALSMLFGRNMLTFVLLVLLYLYSKSFVVHYWLLFLLVGMLSKKNKKLVGIGLAMSLSFGFDLSRANLVAETGLVLLYLVLLKNIGREMKITLPKISVLYFYFIQAIVFNFMFLNNIFGLLFIIASSYVGGYYMPNLEVYLVNKFRLNRFSEGIINT